MTTKTSIKVLTTLISLIVMTLMLTAGDSFADRRDRRAYSPRHTNHEKVIARQHVKHSREWSARKKFRYRRGEYYRPYRDKYYSARTRIKHRYPYGYRTGWRGDSSFFYFSGTLYESPPPRYVIVKTPPETVVVRETSTITSPVEAYSGKVLVTVSTLNVRSGPDLDYSLVHQVIEGSILNVSGKTDGWLYVELANGQSGWVKSVFTEPLGPGSG